MAYFLIRDGELIPIDDDKVERCKDDFIIREPEAESKIDEIKTALAFEIAGALPGLPIYLD